MWYYVITSKSGIMKFNVIICFVDKITKSGLKINRGTGSSGLQAPSLSLDSLKKLSLSKTIMALMPFCIISIWCHLVWQWCPFCLSSVPWQICVNWRPLGISLSNPFMGALEMIHASPLMGNFVQEKCAVAKKRIKDPWGWYSINVLDSKSKVK